MNDPLILIVDNDPYDVKDMRRIMGPDARILVASTLAEARKLLDIPDLIILDMVLANGDGVELIQEMETRGLNTPIIAVSAWHEYKEKVKDHVVYWLDKPLESSEFLMAVASALDTSAALKRLKDFVRGA